jgi:hypothetical protein
VRWLDGILRAVWVRAVGPEGLDDRRREEETRRVLEETREVIDRLREKMEHPVFDGRSTGGAQRK